MRVRFSIISLLRMRCYAAYSAVQNIYTVIVFVNQNLILSENNWKRQILSPQLKLLPKVDFPYMFILCKFFRGSGFKYGTFEKKV